MKKTNNLKEKFCLAFKKYDFNFIGRLKYLLVSSIFIILLASIIFGFFGANLNTNYGQYYEFNVEFNTELTTQQLNEYKDDISDVLKSSDINKYSIIKQGELYANSFAVRVAVVKNISQSNLLIRVETAKDGVEELLSEDFEFLTIGEIKEVESVFNLEFVFVSLFPMLILLGIFAAYLLIRFDGHLTLAGIVSILLDALLVTSLLVLFRIPLSTMMFTVIGLTMIYSTFINLIHFNKIRDLNENSSVKLTNSSLVGKVLKESFLTQLVISLFIVFVSIALMVIRTPETLETGLGLILMVVTVFFTSNAIIPSIWALIYNKEKDKKLQRKLEKAKETKKDDGIVV